MVGLNDRWLMTRSFRTDYCRLLSSSLDVLRLVDFQLLLTVGFSFRVWRRIYRLKIYRRLDYK